MQNTPQAPVLDLRGETITSTLDLRDAFHRLCLCPEEHQTCSEQCPKGRRKPKKFNPILRTSEEERHYETMRGSALATQIACSHSRAQANSTVKRGPSHKIRIKKLPKEKSEDKSTQTSKETKQTR